MGYLLVWSRACGYDSAKSCCIELAVTKCLAMHNNIMLYSLTYICAYCSDTSSVLTESYWNNCGSKLPDYCAVSTYIYSNE